MSKLVGSFRKSSFVLLTTQFRIVVRLSLVLFDMFPWKETDTAFDQAKCRYKFLAQCGHRAFLRSVSCIFK